MKQNTSRIGTGATASLPGNQKLKKAQLAFYLQVCPRQVEKMMLAGKIPFEKYGRRCVRFDLEKVEKALGEFEVKATSGKGAME